MIFDQGDIIRLSFDPTVGHEPSKERPALVVSKNRFNRATNMTVVCPITSQDNGFPLHDKLPDECMTHGWIVLEQLRALDLDSRHAKYIEHLDEPALNRVIAALRSFF